MGPGTVAATLAKIPSDGMTTSEVVQAGGVFPQIWTAKVGNWTVANEIVVGKEPSEGGTSSVQYLWDHIFVYRFNQNLPDKSSDV